MRPWYAQLLQTIWLNKPIQSAALSDTAQVGALANEFILNICG